MPLKKTFFAASLRDIENIIQNGEEKKKINRERDRVKKGKEKWERVTTKGNKEKR